LVTVTGKTRAVRLERGLVRPKPGHGQALTPPARPRARQNRRATPGRPLPGKKAGGIAQEVEHEGRGRAEPPARRARRPCSTRPARSRATRSARSMASSWSWVTKMVVIPVSSCTRRSQWRRSLRTLASKAPGARPAAACAGRWPAPGPGRRAVAGRRRAGPDSARPNPPAGPATEAGHRLAELRSFGPAADGKHIEAEGDVAGYAHVPEQRVVLKPGRAGIAPGAVGRSAQQSDGRDR